MSHPEILRHSGAHTVEVGEGAKDASPRHPSERHALPQVAPFLTPDPSTPQVAKGSPKPNAAQLFSTAVESQDMDSGDQAMADRLEHLRQRNQALRRGLHQLTQLASKEDAHE